MIAKIFKSGNSLALRLPKELEPRIGEVEIQAVGERWVVTPVKPTSWPEDFFARIRLEDGESLQRPPQGKHRPIRL